MSTLTTFVRRLRPVDVLLPIGAALVSAGLQNLADRERRSRGRLESMATLAADHLGALRAAGVAVPDELAADEEHPLDPGVPWLSQHASADPDDDEPDATPARRPWKLAALALLGAAGITAYNHRDQLAATLFGVKTDLTPAGLPCRCPSFNTVDGSPHYYDPEHCRPVDEQPPADDPLPNEGRETPAAPWPTCLPDGLGVCANKRHGHGPVDEWPERDPADELPQPDPEPLESCGWPNCTWTSDPGKSVISQGTAAAVHRNRCVYRPAGAAVSGT